MDDHDKSLAFAFNSFMNVSICLRERVGFLTVTLLLEVPVPTSFVTGSTLVDVEGSVILVVSAVLEKFSGLSGSAGPLVRAGGVRGSGLVAPRDENSDSPGFGF